MLICLRRVDSSSSERSCQAAPIDLSGATVFEPVTFALPSGSGRRVPGIFIREQAVEPFAHRFVVVAFGLILTFAGGRRSSSRGYRDDLQP